MPATGRRTLNSKQNIIFRNNVRRVEDKIATINTYITISRKYDVCNIWQDWIQQQERLPVLIQLTSF